MGEHGRSACTTICMVAARRALDLLRSEGEVESVIRPQNVDAWMTQGICLHTGVAGGRGREHTSLDELWGLGDLKKITDGLERHQLLPSSVGARSFDAMLTRARQVCQEHRCAVGIIVTKPPETVLVLMGLEAPVVLFDSHPRPDRGLVGAYAVQFETDPGCANALAALFPIVRGLEDCGMMAESMNQFEATVVYAAKSSGSCDSGGADDELQLAL